MLLGVEEDNRINAAKEILNDINIRIYKRRTGIPEFSW
jgi:hypothetical protein